MRDNDQAGTADASRPDGSRLAEIPSVESQLRRVLLEAPVLDRLLDDGDKASLAATSWGALEIVLRKSRAVLKVHPDDPVLAGVAARLKHGPCDGAVTACGVRVPATDAGALAQARALLVAAEKLYFDVPRAPDEDCGERELRGNASSEDATRAWVELVGALTRGPRGARVTALTLPDLRDRPTATAEARAVAEVVLTPAVRDCVRSVKVVMGREATLPDEAVGELHSALRCLLALKDLELVDIPLNWACLVGQYSCPTTLDLRQSAAAFPSAGWGSFFDAMESAEHLRSLALPSGNVRLTIAGRPRTLPAGLEHLCVNSTDDLCWWEATDLRSLRLMTTNYPPHVLGRLAELIGRCGKLRRVVVDFADIEDPRLLVPVFAALGRSAVQELSFAAPECTPHDETELAAARAALTAAVVGAVRDSAALRHLEMLGLEFFVLDRAAVVRALHGHAALRSLAIDAAVDATGNLGAALGALLRSNTPLEELRLGAFNWFPDGCRELLRGLGDNRTLQVLRLRCDPLYPDLDDGAVLQVLDALYGGGRHEGRQLRELGIGSFYAGARTLECIATILGEQRSRKLRRVAVQVLAVGDGGVQAIARALRRNCWLESLVLGGLQGVTMRGWEALGAALVDNTTLRHLDVREGRGDTLDSVPVARRLWNAQQYAIAQRQAAGHGH